jgi:hypothetical protein
VAGGPDGGPVEGEAVNEHDPREDYDDEPWRRRATPRQLVRIPATTIEVLAAIQLAFSLLGFFAPMVFIFWDLVDPQVPDSMSWDEAALVTLIFGLCLTWNWVILWGARQMRRCRNHRMALAAAAMSILSLPFLYLGAVSIPVAIWAVLILGRRDVRARFAAVARAAVIEKPTPESAE